MSPDQSGRVLTDHDLPMLRVHRAWAAAEKIAEAHGIDRALALSIARKTVEIIGGGTQRWGHLCVGCRSLLVVDDDGRLRCPQHGPLGSFGATTLLIAFDPMDPAVPDA